MKFTDLNLHPDLGRGLNEAGYITCMPVQEQVLEHAFGGQDLYVQSQTGTGKTAAFLVVIFQRLLTEDMLAGKKAIIMAPTRELAVQIEEEAKLIGKYLPFKIGSFYGGVGYTQQTAMLRDNVQIMVGTPGRVLDLNQSGQMNLMDIAFLILDEADRMFDMGFYPDLRKLIRRVPPADRRQTMLFSATLNAWVKNLAWEYTRNPFEIAIEPETVTVEEVEQILYHVSSNDKMKLLLGILKSENPESAVIFCNTKRYAEIVAKRLRLNGFDCEFIMGDLPQKKRLKIIDDIKAGKLHLLVATDVAARGLDIEGLAMVVNYDLPNETENYVHRIGRTARAGKTGKAVTLASEQDVYALPGIERYIGRKIPSETVAAELFAEDKSEGKHIHTEFYEERGGHRTEGHRTEGRHGDHSRRKSSGGINAGGMNAGGIYTDGKKHDASHHVRKEHHGSMEQKRGEKKSRAGEQGRSFQNPSGDFPKGVKLSELSLEERMAYYRQKYDKSVKAGGSKATDGSSKKPEFTTEAAGIDSKAHEPKVHGTSSTQKKHKSAYQRKQKKHKPAKQEHSVDKSDIAQTAAVNQKQKAPKKGILSRIFSVFKK
jgi:ATP-dependent RNA helicase RhlB